MGLFVLSETFVVHQLRNKFQWIPSFVWAVSSVKIFNSTLKCFAEIFKFLISLLKRLIPFSWSFVVFKIDRYLENRIVEQIVSQKIIVFYAWIPEENEINNPIEEFHVFWYICFIFFQFIQVIFWWINQMEIVMMGFSNHSFFYLFNLRHFNDSFHNSFAPKVCHDSKAFNIVIDLIKADWWC